MGNDITAIPGSPQERFLASTIREVGYGGQAGGGKSFALILDALYQIDKQGYNAILFRRTFKQLSGADGLIELSRRVYPRLGGTYLKSEHLWTFSDYPGTIRFAHLEHEDSVTNYEGHQYSYLGFDELQSFYESQYLYMFSRNRSSNPDIKPYTRATFMPGDIGHFWVKKRFVDTKITYTPKWYRRIEGVDTEVGASDPYAVQRMFIPARLEDNPHLYRDGHGDYERGLYQLDAVDFLRRRKGDWNIRRSGRVYYAFSEKNIVQSGALKLGKASGFYTAHDFGAVNEAAGIFAKAGNAYILFYEYLFPEGTTASKAAHLKAHLTGRKLVSSVGGSLSEKQQRYDWAQAGIPIRAPLISDVESQINKVNEMFADGTLLIASDCVLTIDQLENCVRDQNEKIADKSTFHHCFVADTLISTISGLVPVQLVSVGDLVKTRYGYRRVTATGVRPNQQVMKLKLSNGNELVGTPDHPIFTSDGNSTRLDALRYCDTILLDNDYSKELRQWQGSVKQSGLTGPLITGIQIPRVQMTGNIFAIRDAIFIEQSGNCIMGQFPMDTRYIIGMETQEITISPISKSSNAVNISPSTTCQMTAKNCYANTYQRSGRLLPSGINPKLADNGMARFQEKHGKHASQKNISVRTAAKNLLAENSLPMSNFARITANQPTVENLESITKPGFARTAGDHSPLINMPTLSTAQVIAIAPFGQATVYNLTVEGQHEYFANGILVSNCDVLRYFAAGLGSGWAR